VIDIELWKFLTVLGSAAVLMFGAGLVLGRWGLPSRRDGDDFPPGFLESNWRHGYNTGVLDAGGEVERDDPEDEEPPALARAVTQVYSPLTPYADWREQTAAELAPAHLDELAEQAHRPVGRCWCDEFHREQPTILPLEDWPTDTRLPAILTLGQAGDGSDKTFARASLAQWDFMVRFRDERDELDRMLAAGRAA
jgi:hypothetical protein